LMENLGKNLFAMHQKENLGNIPPWASIQFLTTHMCHTGPFTF
jgi:hypothetical protein